jgi:hypothetical protein
MSILESVSHRWPAEEPDNRRAHTTTVIRAAITAGNVLTLVVSVDPFGPNPSAHYQTYDVHPNGRTTLRSDSPYRLEETACSKFDSIFGDTTT